MYPGKISCSLMVGLFGTLGGIFLVSCAMASDVWFRCDGGGTVGWGHLSRCRLLAAACSEVGRVVRWVCRDDPVVKKVLGREADLQLPGSPSFDPLHPDELDALGQVDRSWLVLDHYGAGENYISEAQTRGWRVLVIDDHQHRSGDLRLAPFDAAAGPGDLSGWPYVLVAPVFVAASRNSREGWTVCFGGSDARGLAAEVVHRWLETSGSLPSLTVVAPTLDARMEGLLGRWPAPVTVHREVSTAELAKVFASSAAVVCSASTVALEALASGAPVVAVAWIENQAPHAAALRAAGVPAMTDPLAAADAVAAGAAVASPGLVDRDGPARVVAAMAEYEEMPCPGA